MQVRTKSLNEILSPIKNYFHKETFSRQDVNRKPPLKAELLSVEQLEQHAKLLANSHKINLEHVPEQLIKRLHDNEAMLFNVAQLLHKSIGENKTINPAGEWLLDNFYLIEEQLKIGKKHLPKDYSIALPNLDSGKSKGLPRVYDIVLEIISHSDGHVNIESLGSFISAYQKINTLTLGELWAIPIMLRLALIENLRRVAGRMAIDSMDSDCAESWAERIIDQIEKRPRDLVLVIGDMARSNPPMGSAFVASFVKKLQSKDLDFALPLSWMEQHLSDTGHSINSLVFLENQKQASDQVSMSNSINSIRFLTKMDWRDFVESMSVVEATLKGDVMYSKMDFYTRDSYRHAVESISKKSHLTENEVANLALKFSNEAAGKEGAASRKAHVGYFLVDNGATQLRKEAKVRLKPGQFIRKTLYRNAYFIYVTMALVLTMVVTTKFLFQTNPNHSIPLLILFLPLFLLISSQLAMELVNWQATLLITPKPLPKLDFSKGVPDNCLTLVVVPTLIVSPNQIEKLVEELEVRYLSNREPNLLFGLLTDWVDSKIENLPEDGILLSLIQSKIENLNLKYGKENEAKFLLFHRPRIYNSKDKIWMGYERKRGKLAAMNHLLRGAGKEHFLKIIGDEKIYTRVRYVITLDADTQLPREACYKLIGLMAHPLNHPVYCEKKRRITEGYGIIQPRLAISLQGVTRSLYSKMHENDSGIDPYTHVTSDVYQDVFSEGSFIGKGIYDVDAFEKVTHERFPENRILSHDLLEGAYARCGFASDVQFYEEYPSSYSQDLNRRSRWIRGDWQIASWILPLVPETRKNWQKNPLNALSVWKLVDNLRRSLLPIAFTAILVLSWTQFGNIYFWAMNFLAIYLLPAIISSCWSLVNKPKEITLSQHVKIVLANSGKSFLQSFFNIALLPFEAFIGIRIILLTLWRMKVSGKHLLQWNSSETVKSSEESIFNTLRWMWIAPLTAFMITWYLYIKDPMVLWVAGPFLILWLVSPLIVYWISRPLPEFTSHLNALQKLTLRELARRTWAFFDHMVVEGDNWLPPDNLQLYPIPVVAHRTSPTNIGLSLLSALAARDFGYATTSRLLENVSRTFGTLEKLERYKGHFYNWYDTETLNPLYPKYVSTVDSGNLVGHLLTLRQGLFEIPKQKISSDKVWDGLHDTIRIIANSLEEKSKPDFGRFTSEFVNIYNNLPQRLDAIKIALENFFKQILAFSSHSSVPNSEAGEWIQMLSEQIKHGIEEIDLFLPAAGINKEFENLTLEEYAESGSGFAKERIQKIFLLADQCCQFADLEYDFLYDSKQHLLSIGYNIENSHYDESYYDLLASEARLSSFVGIAQGKLPQENWFALGRRLTSTGNTPVLLSWSGSMFEFLMPNLVMPTYENTLLDMTSKGCVKKQIEYGALNGIPWGISESCYNMVDSNLTYQYKAFGVPGLGFKRGLASELVIAPYATVLSLMVDPLASYNNLEVLRSEGFHGKYGYFEAIDYTKSRLPRNKTKVIIQTFMAHHQGMGFLSLAYLLLDQPMQRRFVADREIQTALLLLQERVPKTTGFYKASGEKEQEEPITHTPEMRVFNTGTTVVPEVQLLSNGKYHVMVTNSGSGYSRWKELTVTRWREDSTCDNWGSYCYVRNVNNGYFWSATHQPTLKEASQYEVVFSEGRVEFKRSDRNIETHTEIIVSPEDDIEIRRTKITNHTDAPVTIEVTSYAEVVLAPAASDDAHPAFSNLFVQTAINFNQNAILCSRRPRSDSESPPWMLHLMKLSGATEIEISYESDRFKFVGRGNSLENPIALSHAGPLTNSEGSVLDPIVSIRYTFKIEPRECVTVDSLIGIGDSQTNAQHLIDKYQDLHMRDRVFELAFTHAQVVLRQINASESEAQLYNRLASPVIYANSFLRAAEATLNKNRNGQNGLWSYSISGDIPIILLQISDASKIELVKQLIQARSYWALKGLVTDLVILNEDPSGYRQVLQEQIQGLIAGNISLSPIDSKGGIFTRASDQMPTEDLVLLETVARVIVTDSRGTLTEQLNKRGGSKLTLPKNTFAKKHEFNTNGISTPVGLELFNGLGGFTPDGKEYVIFTAKEQRTPLPWCNVIANKNFGTVVTESGSSYTWAENAHSYRLTPWHNDPVKDIQGEAVYIKDLETGNFWSPSPLPARGKTPYITRHGFGYTIFEHLEDGIYSELTVFVDTEASIKFMTLKVKNQSQKFRKLSATGYIEWVLGSIRARTGMYTVTEKELNSGALLARNSYNMEFNNHVSFLHTDETNLTFTADRTEFIGRNGTLANPLGLSTIRLSGKTGAGLDACAAIQVSFDLEDGHEKEITFKLGTAKNMQEASSLIQQFKGRTVVLNAQTKVNAFWTTTLSGVQIQTPDKALNILANGWLLYQVLSSRLWGRSGFYQSGGAYGFRDQLQDVMSLIHADPALTRKQILLSASRQFPEGDVQHWWHPPLGRGVRTLCSDDYLWLPFATARYVNLTGDIGILDESTTFIGGRQLNTNEESYYDLPIVLDEQASLYEHCKRAVIHGLRYGEHGLPLMGAGDWNDGMNMVGIEGKGESVWLAWFLYDVLIRFSKIAEARKDKVFSDKCLLEATKLKQNINKNAWDGAWYIRAYFDDGTPLGSSKNTECRIDAISQSWSVLSDAGEKDHSLQAMESVNKHLVNRQKQLIQLLDPPFDKSDPDPGYIRGYVPGVRENGGQYTHAAIWTVMAYAKLGKQDITWELLQLINPLNHGRTADEVAIYKAEPYVMAADVYGVSPHTGRGGWTWYTGSAGWMYMLILESFLGLKREGEFIHFTPCIPHDWKEFTMNYRYHATNYTFNVKCVQTENESGIWIDNILASENCIKLNDDKNDHLVQINYFK
jgi:cyclic beta-1,2-glucan synthetase